MIHIWHLLLFDYTNLKFKSLFQWPFIGIDVVWFIQIDEWIDLLLKYNAIRLTDRSNSIMKPSISVSFFVDLFYFIHKVYLGTIWKGSYWFWRRMFVLMVDSDGIQNEMDLSVKYVFKIFLYEIYFMPIKIKFNN